MYIQCDSIINANKIIGKIDSDFGFPCWSETEKTAQTYAIPERMDDGFVYLPMVDLQYKKKKKEVVKVKFPQGLVLGLITDEEYNVLLRQRSMEDYSGNI